MTIRFFFEEMASAAERAKATGADRFVHTAFNGVYLRAYSDRQPKTDCWKVTPGGEVYKESYLLVGGDEPLRLLESVLDVELTERIAREG